MYVLIQLSALMTPFRWTSCSIRSLYFTALLSSGSWCTNRRFQWTKEVFICHGGRLLHLAEFMTRGVFSQLPLQERHTELLRLADNHSNIEINAASVEQARRYHLCSCFHRVRLLLCNHETVRVGNITRGEITRSFGESPWNIDFVSVRLGGARVPASAEPLKR